MTIWILLVYPNGRYISGHSGMFEHVVIVGSCHVVRSYADRCLLLLYFSMWSLLPRVACALRPDVCV